MLWSCLRWCLGPSRPPSFSNSTPGGFRFCNFKSIFFWLAIFWGSLRRCLGPSRPPRLSNSTPKELCFCSFKFIFFWFLIFWGCLRRCLGPSRPPSFSNSTPARIFPKGRNPPLNGRRNSHRCNPRKRSLKKKFAPKNPPLRFSENTFMVVGLSHGNFIFTP